VANEKLEKFVRESANKVGLDITRYRPERTDVGRLATMLAHHKVDCVLDIGANIGQFAQALRNADYSQRIISFEPLSDANRALTQAAAGDANWEVAPRCVVGDRSGETEIHIAGNSVSSSVLAMLDSHVAAAPESDYVGTEQVPMNTLDALLAEMQVDTGRCFLKIDTQGYESQVLDGAGGTLRTAIGVQLEMSLMPLYEHQALYDELVERVRGLGFGIWAIWPALFDPTSGRMVQADVTFFRN
jgi:FkbM family methyltransferase